MIIGLIPSRLHSTRLPEKALTNIDGLPLIVHTYKRAKMSLGLDELIVCKEDKKIFDVINEHGGKATMTSTKHVNGTERIAEVATKHKARLIIDVQGDEPLLNPRDIDLVINFHIDNPHFDIVVPSHPSSTPGTKNVVKIVSDKKGKVLYFSRAEIPYPFKKNNNTYFKHLSIISFKPEALKLFSKTEESDLEKIEGIELLRAIENGLKVGTFPIAGDSFPIDVKEDLKKALEIMPNDKIRKLYK